MPGTQWSKPQVCTLVYVFHRDALLMLLRRKEPNMGLWSPPGGHVAPGETPLATALRELREETALDVDAASLRLVVSELDPVRRQEWLIFGFVAHIPSTDSRAGGGHPTLVGGPEGVPEWIGLDALGRLPTPPADPQLLAMVLDERPGVAFARVRFDDGRLGRMDCRWA